MSPKNTAAAGILLRKKLLNGSVAKGGAFLRKVPIGCLACLCTFATVAAEREPVDWVNPLMGNISHLLVPCYPTVQRPNGMMRFLPPNVDFIADRIRDFRMAVVSHRDRVGVFRLQPFLGSSDVFQKWVSTYDRQHVTPYSYDVWLDTFRVGVSYAPATQSAVFSFTFGARGTRAVILVPVSRDGQVEWKDGTVVGEDKYRGMPVYLHAECDVAPSRVEHEDDRMALVFPDDTSCVKIRYAISLVSATQACANLRAEIGHWDIGRVADEGRRAWNRELGCVSIEGGTDDQKSVFYTSLWRCFERMVDFTEGGRYCGWDGKVHEAGGSRYYCDDWVWDTYRAHHPLMVLLRPQEEGDKLTSYIRMAQQTKEGWMPTFPSIDGDSHYMNGFHTVAIFLDAWRKGVRNFDLKAAYGACVKTMRETTKVPWLRGPKNELDRFYDEHGYFPALKEGESETVAGVKEFEKRQAVAVTLAASYDAWCLAEMAKEVGDANGEAEFRAQAANYRNLWKPDTRFFHPKDKDGRWIEPFDYKFSGGTGSRAYYAENNAWTYLWDVQHDLPGLVALLGGEKRFIDRLDDMFNESLGCRRFDWPTLQPDATAMMGQFSMGNEPSFHIPYLYAVAGHPDRTQKMIRRILSAWFRNDLMGVPGDEDGGGMSAFVVFSMMGFYPVTPGLPEYVIGSPVFTNVAICREGKRDIVISAPNSSEDTKYVHAVFIGGRLIGNNRITHADLTSGREILFKMSIDPPLCP